ncbi:hypothetical protein JXB27_02280 [Candidatus Woesearchaeota archaeon]|nr:hypothetical protein [Candidatus Woesearchaeota archaeon]
MGTNPGKINEDYISRGLQRKSESYFLGASNFTYRRFRNDSGIFQNKRINLMQIIKKLLDSENTISKLKDQNSHVLQITSKKLVDRLSEYGLSLPKEERRFPASIDNIFLPDFVRGFIEASAGFSVYSPGFGISFNKQFLQEMHNYLADKLKLDEKDVEEDRIEYKFYDAQKIKNLIYRNFSKLKKQGICLPEIKEKFDAMVLPPAKEKKISISTKNAQENVAEILRLIIEGKPYRPFIDEHFSFPFGAYRNIKAYTGLSLKQIKRAAGWKTPYRRETEEKMNTYRNILAENEKESLRNFLAKHGYAKNRNLLSRHVRAVFGCGINKLKRKIRKGKSI